MKPYHLTSTGYPPVVVGQSLDVIFSTVVTALHLNDLQGMGAGTGPMHRSDRNEQGAPGSRTEPLPLHLKFAVAVHDHPVFTAVSMTLPADAEAWVNPESFDEVGITFAEILVPSPGTKDARERIRGIRFQGVTMVTQHFVANPASQKQ
jgi:hypothetical protein